MVSNQATSAYLDGLIAIAANFVVGGDTKRAFGLASLARAGYSLLGCTIEGRPARLLVALSLLSQGDVREGLAEVVRAEVHDSQPLLRTFLDGKEIPTRRY